MESEQWARLPDGVPLRGLVRNYARFLETDVEAVLRLLDNEMGSPRTQRAAPVSRRPLPQTGLSGRGDPAPRTWVWLFLILVLLGVTSLYAVNRGWVPDAWLIFDWLRAIKQ
jgi:cytoskeletal protein RodZ